MKRETFTPIQAQKVAAVFAKHQVDYMFIGKGGAILLGYPGTTQDVDIFPRKDEENGKCIVTALSDLGFALDSKLENEIVRGKDFVQIKTGPFDVDLVFAPDGISDFRQAQARSISEGIFKVANLRDIIASKRASGREKDRIELHLLESFRIEFEKQHPSGRPL